MICIPIILFAIAAVCGLTMVFLKFSGKGLLWSLVIPHGIFAAAGLGVLIVDVLTQARHFLIILALILFLITAVGGFTVLSFHLRRKKQPNSLIVLHGGAAIISYIILITASSI